MNCLTIKELKSNDEILEAFLGNEATSTIGERSAGKRLIPLIRITKWRRHCGADWIQTKDQPFHPADLFVTW